MGDIVARKPRIHMLVGLPRSGKTTYCNYYLGRIPVFSADTFRYLVYNQKFWAGGEETMWAVHDIAIINLLKQRIDVVVDETNTTKKCRKKYVDLAQMYGYELEAVVISTAPGICLERAGKDETLKGVIHRMSQQWEPVSREEGIDSIKIINLGGGIENAEPDYTP